MSKAMESDPHGPQRNQTRRSGNSARAVYIPAAAPRKEDAMAYPNRQRWKLMWPHLARKA